MANLGRIPISALRDPTRRQLELSLNPLKILPTDDEKPRDWRGVAHFAGIDSATCNQSRNSLGEVFRSWTEARLHRQQSPPSLEELQEILIKIDRHDVYEDTQEAMERDAEQYKLRQTQEPVALGDSNQMFEYGCLTTEDVERYREGKPLLQYDAYLLYDDKDFEIARVMMDKLEIEYKLKLIVKDRNLLGGVGFESHAVMKLIAERCSCLIAILTPNLLSSNANMYLLGFAQSISIEQHSKRIIPCKYGPCTLPRQISYLYYLDYELALKFGNFWERINKSVLASIAYTRQSAPVPTAAPANRCTIREVQTDEIQSPAEPSHCEQTAIVCMSDPSTHYPGNSIENSSSSLSEEIISSQPIKQKVSNSFLSRFKKTVNKSVENVPSQHSGSGSKTNILTVLKKKKNKIFSKKKRAIACEA